MYYQSVANYTHNSIRSQKIVTDVFAEMSRMSLARQYKEDEWYQNNHAYQAIVDYYIARNSFDPNVAPELQFRSLYQNRNLTDLKLPVEFAIIQRKLTTIMGNLPKMNWVPLAPDADQDEIDSMSTLFKNLFDYVWYLTDGDIELFKVILCSLIYGTGTIEWWHEYYEKTCELPESVDEMGKVTYRTLTKIVSKTRCQNRDIRHVLFDENALDIGTIQKGVIIEQYGEETFKSKFKQYRIEGVKPVAPVECFLKVGDERRSQPYQVIELVKKYDEVLDQYVLIANGQHINPYEGKRGNKENEGISPIPSYDKMFPIAVFIDHWMDGEFYGLGECTIAKPLRYVKNNIRRMFFDVMKKVGFPTLIIDPNSDFDEEDYEFGDPFIRAEVDEIKPIPVSANLQPAIELDKLTDNDIAVYTGVNILDTANQTKDETATKTALRRESQNALTENYLKFNMNNGFKRLWVGMGKSIMTHYKTPRINDYSREPEGFKIQTKGVKLYRDPSTKIVEEQKEKGIHIFEIKPDDFAPDYDLVLEMSSIAYTKELENQKKTEAITSLKLYPPQANVVNFNKLGEIEAKLGGLPEDVINSDKTGRIDPKGDPNEIMKNLDLIAKPPNVDDYMAQETAMAAQTAAAGQPAPEA